MSEKLDKETYFESYADVEVRKLEVILECHLKTLFLRYTS